MKMSTSKTSGVFADTSTLANWETQLRDLNDKAIETIGRFIQNSDLRGNFEGAKGEGVSSSIEDKMKDAQIKHEKMSDFSGFLQEVIASMEERQEGGCYYELCVYCQ